MDQGEVRKSFIRYLDDDLFLEWGRAVRADNSKMDRGFFGAQGRHGKATEHHHDQAGAMHARYFRPTTMSNEPSCRAPAMESGGISRCRTSTWMAFKAWSNSLSPVS